MAVYVIVWSDLPVGKLLQFGLTLLQLAIDALGEIDTATPSPARSGPAYTRAALSREVSECAKDFR